MILLNNMCSRLKFICDIFIVENDFDHEMFATINVFASIKIFNIFINEVDVDLNKLIIDFIIIIK